MSEESACNQSLHLIIKRQTDEIRCLQAQLGVHVHDLQFVMNDACMMRGCTTCGQTWLARLDLLLARPDALKWVSVKEPE